MAGSHKRETNARFAPRAALVAAPVAILATTSTVALGVAQSAPQESEQPLLAGTNSADLGSVLTARSTPEVAATRAPVVSRSAIKLPQTSGLTNSAVKVAKEAAAAERREVKATAVALEQADEKQWTTAELNLWDESGDAATQVGTLDEGAKVLITGRTREGRDEIVVKGVARWVTSGYLSAEEPAEGVGGVCSNGTTVASWVNDNIKKIHQSVCARFPSIQVYGTRTGSGDHGTGKAVDIMLSGPIGWDVAEYLRANYQAFGISYLIYEQKIWSVERSGEGWRGMENRGGTTANHYDHVHVSIY